MLRRAGQTAEPIGLNFLWRLMGAHVQKVELQKVELQKVESVSYTHLTLPTILRV